ncbi:MAG: DNA-binding transcriptional regulator YiaG [Candidatus Binatia bacterium]|jgi:DNA-binding transcriptional regulator YiaG
MVVGSTYILLRMTRMPLTLEKPKKKVVSAKSAAGNGEKLMAWRKGLGINRVTFAKVAHCSERKLATYEKEAELPLPVRRQTTEAVRLLKALGEIITEEELSAWLQKPNRGFGRRAPLAVIEAGETDLLWDMIHQIRQGAFA